jgi:hypothetical protein
MKKIQSLLTQLNAIGLSDAQIGRLLSVPQPTITRIRNGIHKTTSYERGMAIEKLATKLLRKKPEPDESDDKQVSELKP